MGSSHSFSKTEIYAALQTHFGFDQFRPLQKEIVTTILEGQDCLAILPTGGGKSLCYQLPGLLLPGVTIVISPLISLMTDQVGHLREKNITAVALNSSLNQHQQMQIEHEILTKVYKFIYVSPEKLVSQQFQRLTQNLLISLIVIDEAHCISEWGHHFRPEYRQISHFIDSLVVRPMIAAFTASATPTTAKDIFQQLKLTTAQIFRQSVLRQNLSLQVISCPTRTIQFLILLRLLRKHASQSILIYCATRRQTEEVSQLLSQLSYIAHPYHAGLPTQKRAEVQQAFLTGEYQLICATTAFGMGVDKSDIRLVIHLNIPTSLEGYYQEIGRAGRDGQASRCYLLSLPSDLQLQTDIINTVYPPLEAMTILLSELREYKLSQTVLFKKILKALIENEQEFEFHKLVKTGEEQGWWKVNWQEKKLLLQQTTKKISRDFHLLTVQQNHQNLKLQQIAIFCQQNICRTRQLLLYFEPNKEHPRWKQYRCHQCDVCKSDIISLPDQEEQIFFKKCMHHFGSKKLFDTPLRLLCLQIQAVQSQNKIDTFCLGQGKGWQKSIYRLANTSKRKVVRTELNREL